MPDGFHHVVRGLVLNVRIPRACEHRRSRGQRREVRSASVEYPPPLCLDIFGLPELHAFGAPGNDRVGPATITLPDSAYGLGDPAASSASNGRSVDVNLTYNDEEHDLLVTLHDDPATGLFPE